MTPGVWPEMKPLCIHSAIASLLLTAAAAAEPPVNHAAAGELPSGKGLAAAFPADAGIAKHTGVIFADGFENGGMNGWDEKDEKKQGVFTFPNPGAAELGRHCLRVEAHLGKDTGGGPTKWFESAPSLHVRFYTKFAADCDYVHHFVTLRANKGLRGGDKWTGFGGAGLRPDGVNRFSTAIEPWGNWAKFPPPGKWNFYSYWPDMKVSGDGKYWGQSFLPDAPAILKDQWICVEFLLKHNTPGKPDGEQAFWIDGRLQGHWGGIAWRKSGTLWANALTVESYITENWTKHPVNTVFFDNVVIAKEYIGPAGKP
jgi:hypothetical protein